VNLFQVSGSDLLLFLLRLSIWLSLVVVVAVQIAAVQQVVVVVLADTVHQ
jgi:hypothetical protein